MHALKFMPQLFIFYTAVNYNYGNKHWAPENRLTDTHQSQTHKRDLLTC